MKKTKIVTGAALAILMASNLAFSAEYMMCSVSANSGFAQGLPVVKNGNITCEGEDWKQGIVLKLSELRGQGWKVDQMTAASGDRGKSTIYFLMLKE